MTTKTKRIATIDMLRGIAIVGMILCANIGFNSDLPAWMFHAQTPPPTYAFNPDVPGMPKERIRVVYSRGIRIFVADVLVYKIEESAADRQCRLHFHSLLVRRLRGIIIDTRD